MTISDRVAALIGPDREVDYEIGMEVRKLRPFLFPYHRPYTSSLDAAMTLYPEIPDEVPSCPRKATAAALRARGL